jgi:hypothetical protein
VDAAVDGEVVKTLLDVPDEVERTKMMRWNVNQRGEMGIMGYEGAGTINIGAEEINQGTSADKEDSLKRSPHHSRHSPDHPNDPIMKRHKRSSEQTRNKETSHPDAATIVTDDAHAYQEGLGVV